MKINKNFKEVKEKKSFENKVEIYEFKYKKFQDMVNISKRWPLEERSNIDKPFFIDWKGEHKTKKTIYDEELLKHVKD